MNGKLQYLFAALFALCALCFASCSGSDDDGSGGGGELRLTADKNAIESDGKDAVTFRVTYDGTDVSRDPAMHLTQTVGGAQTDMAAGENVFTTTTPGIYTFKASYSAGGSVVQSNEVKVSAVANTAYYQKLLGVQFTSHTCLGCPHLSTAIRDIQQEQPGRLVPVSFHVNYGGAPDPMRIDVCDAYLKKLNPQGSLPRFFLNMHVATEMTSNKQAIVEEMEAEQKNFPVFSGVSVKTQYDDRTRTVTVEGGITSNRAVSFRYLVFLVEDGIRYPQAPDFDPEYVHNNVVRKSFASNLYGDRLNDGRPLDPGVEYRIPVREAILPDGWNPENMRVVVAAMVSHDGDKSYVSNNVNECKLGESADYVVLDQN